MVTLGGDIHGDIGVVTSMVTLGGDIHGDTLGGDIHGDTLGGDIGGGDPFWGSPAEDTAVVAQWL